MSSIRAVTGPIVLAALFVTTPQLAVGQPDDDESVEITCRACRPGAEIEGDQLMEFLAENLNVRFTESAVWADALYVALRLEMVSREEGVIGKFESEAVEVEAGTTYSGETWMVQRDRHEAPGFGDRRKMAVTGFGTSGDIREAWGARECEGATHAVRITLWSDGTLFWEPNKPINFVCLRVEG